MNRFFLLAFLALIAMAGSVAANTISGVQAAGTDLIINGGFEQFVAPDPQDWGGYSLVGWTGGADSELAGYGATHGGNYALHVYSGNVKTQENIYTDGFASNVTSLSFSGWAHAENTDAIGYINVTTGNWDGTTLTVHDTLDLATDALSWTELTGTLDVKHGSGVNMTNYIKVVVSSYNPALFDDISLRTSAIPEPSAMVMALLGLIGLVAYAWRKRK